MNNKTVIITGANSGIGKAAALKFAENGHKVVLACRNQNNAEKVLFEIKEKTKNENIYFINVDMSSFNSVKNFCKEFNNKFDKLDIIIHNAAYFNHGENFKLSEDGIEIAFATNVVSPFLMNNLLLEKLKKSDDARILNASSNIVKHFFSPKKELILDYVINNNNNKKLSVYQRYCNSKMAFLILTFIMADKYKEFNINVNSVQINGAKMSPQTLKKFKYPWKLIAIVQNLFFAPPELFADIYFEVCTSDKYKNVTGKSFNHKNEIMKAASENPNLKEILSGSFYPLYAHNEKAGNEIMEMCERVTN